MKNLILVLGCFFFLISCQQTEKEKLEELVKNWNGKEVLFPTNPSFTLYGKTPVDFKIPVSDYKIVTYVDSLGCSSCKLQLPKWKEFMKYADSIVGYQIPVLFFLHPANVREMRSVLKQNRFDYPVCMDTEDTFNKVNKFPSQLNFQTFLLDKNNHVIAIGNPVHNYDVRELYIHLISGGIDGDSLSNMRTVIKIEEDMVDLGSFDWRREQHITFEIHNIGNNNLVVYDNKTSCGCTSVEYSKEPVQPGKSLAVKVTYKADHPEHFNKSIILYCNASASPLELKITGNAK